MTYAIKTNNKSMYIYLVFPGVINDDLWRRVEGRRHTPSDGSIVDLNYLRVINTCISPSGKGCIKFLIPPPSLSGKNIKL